MALHSPLSLSSPWLLDGPTGTELERRGYATSLPLWTALAVRDCPELLRAVHRDYLVAGADVITACTFRTSRHSLAKAGLAREARALTREAVALARDAAAHASRPAWVAGSIAPLEDCYAPARTPPQNVLRREHAMHAEALVDAGADLLLIETMPTLRESLVAARAASATGLPFVVSWIVRDGARLLDGTRIEECVDAILRTSPALLSVNCASVQACSDAIPLLARAGVPFGAYANSGAPDGPFGFAPAPLDAQHYTAAVREWLRAGATMAGGCCGTEPSHIAGLRALLDASVSATGANTSP